MRSDVFLLSSAWKKRLRVATPYSDSPAEMRAEKKLKNCGMAARNVGFMARMSSRMPPGLPAQKPMAEPVTNMLSCSTRSQPKANVLNDINTSSRVACISQQPTAKEDTCVRICACEKRVSEGGRSVVPALTTRLHRSSGAGKSWSRLKSIPHCSTSAKDSSVTPAAAARSRWPGRSSSSCTTCLSEPMRFAVSRMKVV